MEQIEPNFNKKQNHKVTIFAILLSVISIGLLIFGFMAVSSDKVVMLQSVSNLTNKLDQLLDSDEEMDLLDQVVAHDDVGIRYTMNLDSMDQNMGIIFNSLSNKKEQRNRLDVTILQNQEELFDANVIFDPSKMYFFIDDITPQYYYLPVDSTLSYTSSLNSEDLKKILDILKESINNCIEEENIQKSKTTILYQGKEKKVNKLSYEITDETIKQMLSSFTDSLKNDTKLLKNIADFIEISEEKILSTLEDFIHNISGMNSDEKLYYNVYYYGFNKIVLYELSSNEDSIRYQIEEKEKITFTVDNEEFFSLETIKNNDQYEFEGYLQVEQTKLGFHGTSKDGELIAMIDTDEGTIKLAINSTAYIEQQKNYQAQETIKISFVSGSVEQEILKLSIQQDIYWDEKIDTTAITDSVSIEDISEEETLTIYENLMNHPLYQYIENLGIEELSL